MRAYDLFLSVNYNVCSRLPSSLAAFEDHRINFCTPPSAAGVVHLTVVERPEGKAAFCLFLLTRSFLHHSRTELIL